MEKYVLENQESFELKDIFECGQCFRWNENKDGSYTGVINNAVINVKKNNSTIIFTGKTINNKNFEKIIQDYFDLDTNYDKIKMELSNIDNNLKEATKFGLGIRILNQDLWETIISFIISANNNIPRIKGIIERISKSYGKKIEWNGNDYYLFPTPQELSKASVSDLRNLGLGFRDIRVFNTTHKILNNEISLDILKNNIKTNEIRDVLLQLDGVGPKVADCILLFGFHRFDVFPIDVWVRRVMNELYIKEDDEKKVSKERILKYAKANFNGIEGLAQQYLFYYRRSKND